MNFAQKFRATKEMVRSATYVAARPVTFSRESVSNIFSNSIARTPQILRNKNRPHITMFLKFKSADFCNYAGEIFVTRSKRFVERIRVSTTEILLHPFLLWDRAKRLASPR